ncbi:outer membrane protein assembly factor BamB family protein [Yunchengibacter salinarum]|uniref:outer membrane protein assembly factor BamB family protein n=1 Tax=Yunchengibacter salinarum TaxID=3133399 RepID=UPI0035B64EEF
MTIQTATGHAARTALAAALALSLAACGGSGPRQKYDDGGKERISILTSTQLLEADPGIQDLPVTISRPYRNKSWAQAGGNASHTPYHLALDETLDIAWRADFGKGNKDYERMTAGPVAANGTVYTMDSQALVSAIDLNTGNVKWTRSLEDENERSDVGFGGGVAFHKGRIYATTGYGYVHALDGEDGSVIWSSERFVPFRGAPTVGDGRVFALTQDNQLLVFNQEDGSLAWDQVGIVETAGMLGAASPAFNDDTVVTALSSGELIAMLSNNGRVLWQDALSSARRLTPLSSLSDVDALPVMDRGRVYAVSHSGRMVSIDMRSGERAWEADIAGLNTPWVSGNFAFVTTIDAQVAAVSLADGRLRWITQLQRFRDQEDRRGLISWNGPILAGDRLLVTSSHGYALSLSPYTGEVLSGIELPGGTTTPPIVVDGTFLVQTNDGELIAYR